MPSLVCARPARTVAFLATLTLLAAGCTSRGAARAFEEYREAIELRDWSAAWSLLSDACHHHPYDVAPSSDELSQWIRVASAFRTAIGD